jgi:anti-sigma-K factor RskA
MNYEKRKGMASNHPIDTLFREKTGNVEIKPSANAWESIQAASSQANHRSIRLWHVAAAVSLIAVSALALWMVNSQDNTPALASEGYVIIDTPPAEMVTTLQLPEKKR